MSFISNLKAKIFWKKEWLKRDDAIIELTEVDKNGNVEAYQVLFRGNTWLLNEKEMIWFMHVKSKPLLLTKTGKKGIGMFTDAEGHKKLWIFNEDGSIPRAIL